MTPWLVHELRNLGLEIVCLDARHARAALKMLSTAETKCAKGRRDNVPVGLREKGCEVPVYFHASVPI